MEARSRIKFGVFAIKKIEVHSAGERDPDAQGTTGMSGSKLRAHAAAGKYTQFKKGVPKHVSDEHTKELYNDLRKGLKVKEDINQVFQDILLEGVHDQSIFKVVFLAGGPGSGKDYVISNTLEGQGLIEISSDKALEFLMDKKGLDKTMPATEKDKRDIVRTRAKSITELKQRLAIMGRNGLIVNGTGEDYEKISRIKEKLEELGYESAMILVNTDNEVSKQRNIERGQRGGRTVPEPVRKEKWENVQNSRVEFANKLFSCHLEGWKTDRGMISIIFGTPSYTSLVRNSEVWIYGDENNIHSLKFVFDQKLNPFSSNDYVLSRNYSYKNPWYRAVESWRNGKVYLLK